MSEGTIGIVVLVSLSVLISSTFHIFHKEYVRASIMGGVTSIVLFLTIAHIVTGPEKFIVIALIVGGVFCTLIAFVMGGIIYAIRKYLFRHSENSKR